MFENLKDLIASGKLEKAFEQLGTSNNEVILLRGRYSKNEKGNRMGIIGGEQYRMENARITHSLLSLISEMEEEQTDSSSSYTSSGSSAPDNSKAKKSVFFSYAHEDKDLQREIRKQLAALRRSDKIADWVDEQIKPGEEWDTEIMNKLKAADIILLLISPDFIDSDYIWDKEVKISMEKHQRKEAAVIPIIVRPCDWTDLPFAKLQALPAGGKPITQWDDQDKAILDVVNGIKKLV